MPVQISDASGLFIHAAAKLIQFLLKLLLLCFRALCLFFVSAICFLFFFDLSCRIFVRFSGGFHLPFQACYGFPCVEHIVFQHGSLTVFPGCSFLPAGALLAQLVRARHACSAFLKDAVDFRIDLIHCFLRVLILTSGDQNFVIMFPQNAAGTLQRVQPEADFQRSLFLRKLKKLLSLFGLLL